MDTRQLRYFLAVVDHQGLSRAAEHLFIAQPSLSQAIATLERELGVSLFHRTGRRLILSDAGERLVGPARQVLRDLASAQSTIDAVKGLHTGRVEMISMPSPGIEPLSSLMRRLAERYPGIRISVDAAFVPEEVIYAVRSGACEIGLLGAPTAVQSPDLDVTQLEDQALRLEATTTERSFGCKTHFALIGSMSAPASSPAPGGRRPQAAREHQHLQIGGGHPAPGCSQSRRCRSCFTRELVSATVIADVITGVITGVIATVEHPAA